MARPKKNVEKPTAAQPVTRTPPSSRAAAASDFGTEPSPAVPADAVVEPEPTEEPEQTKTTKAPMVAAKMDLGGSSSQGHARLANLSDKLRRAWGSSAMLPLSKAPVAVVRRLPVGILMIDWKTRGGLVIGRFNRLWGAKSTLKSTLCLRVVRSAQKTCRHCKSTLVVSPETGVIDCRCPSPRFWVSDPEDFSWLPTPAALQVYHGGLPDGFKWQNVKGQGRVPVLTCKSPNPSDEKKASKDVVFTEMYRCEPMRCLYVDSEGTIDQAWAVANGVDTDNVILVGGKWAEQNLAVIDEAVMSKEMDLIVIDSTSMLEPQANLEKAVGERPVVASRANLMGQFARRLLSSAADEGLTARYRPTILCTSQVSAHGIGGSIPPWLGPTDGNVWEHALSLDIKMSEQGYTFDETKTFARYGRFAFEVKKNKAGGGIGAQGLINFWLVPEPDHAVGDSDDLSTVMHYARQMGPGYILEGTGQATLTLFTPYVKEGQVRFPRVGDCDQYLRANPTVYDDLRVRILTKLMEYGATITTPTEMMGAAKK